MDAVADYRPDDFQIDVGPGIIGSDVGEYISGDGLFFPPLPSSGDISTVGGMISTDASGMQTVRYGEVADWVLGLEAVLADGTVVRTGSRASKTSSGYNLTDLIVGSEGRWPSSPRRPSNSRVAPNRSAAAERSSRRSTTRPKQCSTRSGQTSASPESNSSTG